MSSLSTTRGKKNSSDKSIKNQSRVGDITNENTVTTVSSSPFHHLPIVFRNESKISSKNENTFPWRLHFVLKAAEIEDFTHVVSWVDETSFKVKNPDLFVAQIMPRFFDQTKYKSFQRQCNLWGYDRICNGPNKGGYTRNQFFVRGEPALVAHIQRTKIKGELSKRRRCFFGEGRTGPKKCQPSSSFGVRTTPCLTNTNNGPSCCAKVTSCHLLSDCFADLPISTSDIATGRSGQISSEIIDADEVLNLMDADPEPIPFDELYSLDVEFLVDDDALSGVFVANMMKSD